jgi:hypothetical protein
METMGEPDTHYDSDKFLQAYIQYALPDKSTFLSLPNRCWLLRHGFRDRSIEGSSLADDSPLTLPECRTLSAIDTKNRKYLAPDAVLFLPWLHPLCQRKSTQTLATSHEYEIGMPSVREDENGAMIGRTQLEAPLISYRRRGKLQWLNSKLTARGV